MSIIVSPLSNAQICVLVTAIILPAIPSEARFAEHGVYRGLVTRGWLSPDRRGGYIITPEGRAAIDELPSHAIKSALMADITETFPRRRAAE